MAKGGRNIAVIEPKDIFSEALLDRASSIVLAHNHTCASLTPSDADISLTHKLIEASDIVGVSILDHIILNTTQYLSMKAQRYM
jgi:DNA repair protein RadC